MGGLGVLQPQEATRVLWGLASLNHTLSPSFMASLHPQWAWHQGNKGEE